MFYFLPGVPRNKEWQFFVESLMDRNMTVTLTPDMFVIKLVEKEATINRENGQGQEALRFVKGNANDNAKGNG